MNQAATICRSNFKVSLGAIRLLCGREECDRNRGYSVPLGSGLTHQPGSPQSPLPFSFLEMLDITEFLQDASCCTEIAKISWVHFPSYKDQASGSHVLIVWVEESAVCVHMGDPEVDRGCFP